MFKRVTISLSEAVLWVGSGTPHRSLRSLCVVLTINQPLQGCAAVIGAALPRLNGTTLVVIRLFGNFVAVKKAALSRLGGGYFPVFDGVGFGAKIYADFGDWQPA